MVKGRCSRIGRGQAIATRLKREAATRGPSGRFRRVIVKARIVRLKAASRAAQAHLRYLQRDGTTRDGERGRLYGPGGEGGDGRAFVERGEGDRHQFRFIIAPDDADRLADLEAFTRDVMAQMERDLGTRLDWVAVDHFNTGHPHSHVVIRGKDDRGADLVIAQDYITDGLRYRAQERATLELGPETELELKTKLRAEVDAERVTRIDRAMLDAASGDVLDFRQGGDAEGMIDRSLRLARLGVLRRLGLATEVEPGVWVLSERLEPTLRELGERGDIIRAIHRALGASGVTRATASFELDAGDKPIIGRVIGKDLTDELGDRLALIVDGVDGRIHHVGSVDADEVRIGAIVEIGPKAQVRAGDRTIAELAGETGFYQPSRHRQMIEGGELSNPAGDPGDFVESHVRRLEALRRAGIVERLSEDRWAIPEDFEQQAQALDARRGRQSAMRVLSAFDLDQQVTADGATWLDRELVARRRLVLASLGFGAEVEQALVRRTDRLVDQGLAWRDADGGIRFRAGLLATLRDRELDREGATLAVEKAVPFRRLAAGEDFRGRFTGAVELASGKFAVVENAYEFTLVPWRPVIERRLGREVVGSIEVGGGVAWRLGRDLGLEL
ncbi:DUF3363 domain-containing protein [Phenylobacterium montanum]|uniref:Relaxase/mobilization nuclease and DUF3363 domain-containing protein n=1 Tax=Phenylobacterium montanum TaxID=2823693 RepID=A0A975G3F2_9CAUL|nr:DUF3363 domain-containing protein [Caulobacter sp. S6]QUD90418.1 relaxase/mobilization nuclease and DUF3363 domain-containing protein [Caulobacter sp. S6]